MHRFKLNLIVIYMLSSTCTCFEIEGSSSGSIVISAGTVKCVGIAVAQRLRCCTTNRKVTGLIPVGVTGIFH